MMPANRLFFIACLLLTTGIGLGAIGAHALQTHPLITPKHIESWKTAVQYQLIQSLGLMLLGIIQHLFSVSLKKILYLHLAGLLLFSFSIYLLVGNAAWEIPMLSRILGPITPLGGICMMIAWLWTGISLFAALRKKM